MRVSFTLLSCFKAKYLVLRASIGQISLGITANHSLHMLRCANTRNRWSLIIGAALVALSGSVIQLPDKNTGHCRNMCAEQALS